MNKATPTEQIYTAIGHAYDYFNDKLFDGALPACLIVLQRQPRMMGYVSHRRWVNDSRQYVDELAINPEYWLGHPLLDVFQTMAHEACHIWQNYYGTPGRRSYHNREWADKMISIGLMPSTTGRPGGKQTGERMSDYVLSGGAFHRAAEGLIATGFGLPWLDRSATPAKHVIEVYDEGGRGVRLGDDDEQSKALATPIGAVITNVQPANESGSNDAEQQEEPVIMPVAAKRLTRDKYRCDGCKSQVWGKPSLNLVCGDCRKPFAMVV